MKITFRNVLAIVAAGAAGAATCQAVTTVCEHVGVDPICTGIASGASSAIVGCAILNMVYDKSDELEADASDK